MFHIKTYNNIASKGIESFSSQLYQVGPDISAADAILLRSYALQDAELGPELKAIGRAGAGVNNVPVETCSARGIPVFNAPGANANAVKELVIAAALIAARNLDHAWQYVKGLDFNDDALTQNVERGKKQFVGYELPGRTFGVIGLGAIGVKVANAATDLGMQVIGFDPGLTLDNAWQLSSKVVRAKSLDELISRSDFISPHVPLNDCTRGLIAGGQFAKMKAGAVLLNFSREGVVELGALKDALDSGAISRYISDFPDSSLCDYDAVTAFPHLGASTEQAEENCAVMVAGQLRDYLENGNIRNAVNFPNVELPRTDGGRLCVANRNVPNIVGQISSILAEEQLNILDMLNRSQDEMAYTIIDVNKHLPSALLQKIRAVEGVLMVRQL